MSSVVNQQKGRIMVYGCGGTGLNIARLINREESHTSDNFASIDVALIDTSRANLHGASVDNFYLIKSGNITSVDDSAELDGSGQKRDENVSHIKTALPEILVKFPPADVNIILHSGSGGSGGPISGLLALELKKRGEDVIVCMVGSRDTGKDIENTIKSLRTYMQISENIKQPIPVFYDENGLVISGQMRTRQYVDKVMLRAINSIAALYSRRNAELDLKDLDHWLNYHKVIDQAPQMVGLHILSKDHMEEFNGQVRSVATLHTLDGGTAIGDNIIPQYQVRGIVNDAFVASEENKNNFPMHFILSDSIITERLTSLIKLENKLKEEAKIAAPKLNLMGENDIIDDDGLVF